MPVTLHLGEPLELYFVMYNDGEGTDYNNVVAAQNKHHAAELWRMHHAVTLCLDEDDYADGVVPDPDRLWLIPGTVSGTARVMDWCGEVTLVDYP